MRHQCRRRNRADALDLDACHTAYTVLAEALHRDGPIARSSHLASVYSPDLTIRGEVAMKRLSGTDALFLSTETPAWHQHVGGLTVVDPAESDRFSFDEVRRTLLERDSRGCRSSVGS